MESIIFHQFQRYKTAQLLLNALRQKESHSILEVGSGSHGNLGKFLPNDHITYLDSYLSHEALSKENFVLGDATCLEYEDQSFDFVIALDVLEHIPQEERRAFLSCITRVAKLGVIMTYPNANSENVCNEQILAEIYHLVGMETPPWVYEHRRCVLPDNEKILEMLSQLVSTENVFTMYQMNRANFFRLLILEALASVNSGIFQIFHAISDYYNNSIFYNDFEGTDKMAAKTCVVWCSEKGVLERVRKISTNHANTDDANLFSQKLDIILNFATLLLKSNAAEDIPETKKYVEDLQNAYANLKTGFDQVQNQYRSLESYTKDLQNQYATQELYTKHLQSAYKELKEGNDHLRTLYNTEMEDKKTTGKTLEELRQFEYKVKATKWWKYFGSKENKN